MLANSVHEPHRGPNLRESAGIVGPIIDNARVMASTDAEALPASDMPGDSARSTAGGLADATGSLRGEPRWT